jgi:hypothetical protein
MFHLDKLRIVWLGADHEQWIGNGVEIWCHDINQNNKTEFFAGISASYEYS